MGVRLADTSSWLIQPLKELSCRVVIMVIMVVILGPTRIRKEKANNRSKFMHDTFII